MSGHVIDASVAIKWYVPEDDSEAAIRFYGRGLDLSAPDLLFPEIGNVLWKKVRRGEMTAEDSFAVLDALLRTRVEIHPCTPLMESALEIANETGASVYDSTFLSLCLKSKASLVTADRRLFHRLAATRFARHVSRLEDVS